MKRANQNRTKHVYKFDKTMDINDRCLPSPSMATLVSSPLFYRRMDTIVICDVIERERPSNQARQLLYQFTNYKLQLKIIQRGQQNLEQQNQLFITANVRTNSYS